MSKTGKIINGIVFSLWVALLALLLYKNYTGTSLEKPQALADAFSKETHWYDIYAGKKKIGYASTGFEKAGEELIIRHEREMKVQKDGKDTVLFERLKCLSDLSYTIKSFEYTSNFKDEKGVKVRGEVDPDTIILFLESAEKRKVHKIPKKDFYFPVTLVPVLVQQRPATGKAFTVPVLNLMTLSIDDAQVQLEEIRPVKVGIDISSVYKFQAGNTTWWSSESGLIIKEKNPMGFTLYAQVEKFAKDPSDRMLFDFTSLPFFQANRTIQNPENLKTFKVKIGGYHFHTALYEKSNVKAVDNILAIEKIDSEKLQKAGIQLPYEGDDVDGYLSPDRWVMSTYKPLQNTGLIYARSNKNDAFRFARYLMGYVYKLVRTRPLFFLSDSRNFLDSLSGDHLERTVMFATYARAGGLPTRLVGGLKYVNGYFYFHTWPEVWFDQWVPVDPTFVQFPADVTHIPLKGGTLEDITSIIHDLKSITIEILEES